MVKTNISDKFNIAFLNIEHSLCIAIPRGVNSELIIDYCFFLAAVDDITRVKTAYRILKESYEATHFPQKTV